MDSSYVANSSLASPAMHSLGRWPFRNLEIEMQLLKVAGNIHLTTSPRAHSTWDTWSSDGWLTPGDRRV